ncbi:MAG: NAD-dependent epimerase/dehydratase family protein, partial [Candidatus Thorarchaeota archaeon]
TPTEGVASMSHDKSVLITGGTGFIGSHLARKLVREGQEVILFDLYPNPRAILDIKDQVRVIEGDVADYNAIVDAIDEYNIGSVIHTAAMLSVAAATELRTAYNVNIDGTFNILEACRVKGVDKVVFISSLAAFGPKSPFPFHETTYREPASFYGVSKVCGEVLGTFYHHTHGLDFRCVRLAVVIGPGRRGKGATVSFSKFVEDVVLQKPGIILVPDYTVLPIIHVEDATNLLLALWKADSVDKRILMSGGVPIAIEEFVSQVKYLVPDADVRYQEDSMVEEVAETWTLLTTMLVQQGQEKVYREIEDIGWNLTIDDVEKIAAHFVDEVKNNRDMYASY